jgi:hypothetical protein
VLTLGACAGGRPADLTDPVPQPAGRAQRRDRRELVGPGRVAELELAEGLVDGETAVGQRPQVGRARGQRTAQLLDHGGARVVEDRRVDDDRPQPVVGGRPPGDVGQPGEILGLPRRRLQAERVQTQRATGCEVRAPLDQ